MFLTKILDYFKYLIVVEDSLHNNFEIRDSNFHAVIVLHMNHMSYKS